MAKRDKLGLVTSSSSTTPGSFVTDFSANMNLIEEFVQNSSYTHTQSVPSATWTITHSLGRRPSVMIVDSSERIVYGDVSYDSDNQITVTFSAAFGGKAYLN